MERPTTKGGYTKEDLRQYALYRKNQEFESMEKAQKEQEEKNLDSLEEAEEYRNPLEITLYKEILIMLSTGGDADGFKLKYYKDELQSGVYYWADWGVYEEIELTTEEAEEVEAYYLYGDPSAYLDGIA